ncbi:MAG TPA: acyltransferase [Smithella sp.]|nr:acyltransferase [Smithella sp.]
MEHHYGKNILPLSTFDNETFIGSSPLEILFFYKKDLPILKLKESLLKTIHYYNLFSSRLIMIGDHKFALLYCTDGAVANDLRPVDACFDDSRIAEIRKEMVHVQTLPGEPLFAVTGIPFKNGILAGISCSHAVADGISLVLFLYAWMCITDGKNFLPPSPQRLFQGPLAHFDPTDRALVPPLSALNDQIREKVDIDNVAEIFTATEYFTDDFLNAIKAEAEKENYDISNHQIMTAFLLKKYHRKILPDTDRIVLKNPINLRDIHPDIDPMYIGSSNFNNFIQFTKEEIDRLSIPQIASRIKKSIADVRNESYAREIAHLSPYGIEINMDVFRRNRPPYSVGTNVVSSNLTHLNDLESMFVGPETGSLLHIGLAVQTGFTMLKEKSGRIFAQITGRHPLT